MVNRLQAGSNAAAQLAVLQQIQAAQRSGQPQASQGVQSGRQAPQGSSDRFQMGQQSSGSGLGAFSGRSAGAQGIQSIQGINPAQRQGQQGMFGHLPSELSPKIPPDKVGTLLSLNA
ncbi:MAG: hypothetical protein AB7P76_01000 [Candidatus Melainabacteria bacterium]